jgi:hypothetical protein
MANLRDIKKINDLFEENLNKQNSIQIKTIEIKESQELILNSNSIINITSNSNLKLNYKKNFCGRIELNIAPDIKVLLIEQINDKNLFRELSINQEKNSTLIQGFSNKNSRYCKTISKLKSNSTYNLKAAYYSDGIENFIRFETYHLEKDTTSNMEINGASINKSRIISDALTNISIDAPNSSGHQKIYGLLLDEDSSIQSEPILEINNNDVSCSHGASISQISQDINFYMNSRGLSKEEVINIFVDGFFELVSDHINFENKVEFSN